MLPDQPNALATFLSIVSAVGVNVLEVHHDRSSMKAGVNAIRVRLVVETRNKSHIEQLYTTLSEKGYAVIE